MRSNDPSLAFAIYAEANIQDQTSIDIYTLNSSLSAVTLVDVRKPKARLQSGFGVENSLIRHPFDALSWHHSLVGDAVIVYCVHGHEVSQAVAGFLRDSGIDCRYLKGGFEAWHGAGLPVVGLNDGGNDAR